MYALEEHLAFEVLSVRSTEPNDTALLAVGARIFCCGVARTSISTSTSTRTSASTGASTSADIGAGTGTGAFLSSSLID